MSLELVTALLSMPPRREVLPAGTRVAAYLPGSGVLDITFGQQGNIEVTGGRGGLIEAEPSDTAEHVSYSDVYPWLILSHIAGRRFETAEGKVGSGQRIDPILLLEVGACPSVLRRPGGDPDVNELPMHDLPNGVSMVCHAAGIVEPITVSILNYLARESEVDAERLIHEAIRRAEPALLARLNVALRVLSGLESQDRASWAHQIRTDHVGPALAAGLGAAFLHD